MGVFRFLHRWPAIIPPESPLADVVPLLDDRDRELEDYLDGVGSSAGQTVISYATGGTVISYGQSFTVAPIPVVSLEKPAGGNPSVAYIADADVDGFKVQSYDGSGAEVAASSAWRVFWHAAPAT